MEFGESIVSGRLVRCTEANYEACASKQILCTACHEASFKCGNPVPDRSI